MSTREERSGELLWRHVVDLRSQEPVTDAVADADELGRELRLMVRMCGDLPMAIAEMPRRGEAEARVRLMSLIARDSAARARQPWWRMGRKVDGARLTLAFALGLLLVLAAWAAVLYASRDTCGSSAAPPTTPPGPMRRGAAPLRSRTATSVQIWGGGDRRTVRRVTLQ